MEFDFKLPSRALDCFIATEVLQWEPPRDYVFHHSEWVRDTSNVYDILSPSRSYEVKRLYWPIPFSNGSADGLLALAHLNEVNPNITWTIGYNAEKKPYYCTIFFREMKASQSGDTLALAICHALYTFHQFCTQRGINYLEVS